MQPGFQDKKESKLVFFFVENVESEGLRDWGGDEGGGRLCVCVGAKDREG